MLPFIYVIICVLLFLILFKREDLFHVLFETIYNNITDYNDPNFTGGIEYVFHPFRHLYVKNPNIISNA